MSGGEASKRFVRKRAPVNNLTSQGSEGSRLPRTSPECEVTMEPTDVYSGLRRLNSQLLATGTRSPAGFFFFVLFYFLPFYLLQSLQTDLIDDAGQVWSSLKPFPCTEILGGKLQKPGARSAKAKRP